MKTSKDNLEITLVKIAKLNPTDTLVIAFNERVTDRIKHEATGVMRRVFPENNILVTDNSCEMSVLRKTADEAEIIEK